MVEGKSDRGGRSEKFPEAPHREAYQLPHVEKYSLLRTDRPTNTAHTVSGTYHSAVAFHQGGQHYIRPFLPQPRMGHLPMVESYR